jgi:hypothetical protein
VLRSTLTFECLEPDFFVSTRICEVLPEHGVHFSTNLVFFFTEFTTFVPDVTSTWCSTSNKP